MAEDTPEAKRYIFIPYARPGEPTYVGDRPLDLHKVTYHSCSSIHVNGVSYDGTPLVPGPVALSVLVSNTGALGAWVTARFYVSKPLAGFNATDLSIRQNRSMSRRTRRNSGRHCSAMTCPTASRTCVSSPKHGAV